MTPIDSLLAEDNIQQLFDGAIFVIAGAVLVAYLWGVAYLYFFKKD